MNKVLDTSVILITFRWADYAEKVLISRIHSLLIQEF